MKRTGNILVSAALVLFIAAATAHALQGKVVGIADDDTITVMNNGVGEKIRLYGVDTPYKKQIFGQCLLWHAWKICITGLNCNG
jgi:endonuclease YncB( thermonuclease family)